MLPSAARTNDNSDVIYLSSSSKGGGGGGGGRHGVMIGFIGLARRRPAVMRLKSQRAHARITRFAAAHYRVVYFRVKSDRAQRFSGVLSAIVFRFSFFLFTFPYGSRTLKTLKNKSKYSISKFLRKCSSNNLSGVVIDFASTGRMFTVPSLEIIFFFFLGGGGQVQIHI